MRCSLAIWHCFYHDLPLPLLLYRPRRHALAITISRPAQKAPVGLSIALFDYWAARGVQWQFRENEMTIISLANQFRTVSRLYSGFLVSLNCSAAILSRVRML